MIIYYSIQWATTSIEWLCESQLHVSAKTISESRKCVRTSLPEDVVLRVRTRYDYHSVLAVPIASGLLHAVHGVRENRFVIIDRKYCMSLTVMSGDEVDEGVD